MFGNRVTSQVYKGGTIFCDAASSKIIVHRQVSFTAEETIISKLKFEMEAMGSILPVGRYYIDNGIYNSKEFTRDLNGKGQGIRHSGVVGHHKNGVADNSIKNVVRISRTMMIHADLRWPGSSEKSLCTMDMDHGVHLNNHTPHISIGIYTEEGCTRSNLSHCSLQNYHPWGCPTYVLEPRL